MLFGVLAHLLDAGDEDDEPDEAAVTEMPLPNVDLATLKKVVEWCEYHESVPVPEIVKPVKSNDLAVVLGPGGGWDVTYADMSLDMLFNVIHAANYLGIEGLLDLGCAKIATMLKGREPKEIREVFGIVEPTREEQAHVERSNAWLFDVRPTPVAAAPGGTQGGSAFSSGLPGIPKSTSASESMMTEGSTATPQAASTSAARKPMSP